MKSIYSRFIILFFISIIVLIGAPKSVSAGFGISPPYLKNQQLVPGSKYVQQITLLRSDAAEDLKATVKVNAPEIASWITIDKGEEFILPKGQVQIPMIVTVNVPKNAEIGNYKGSINIKISSANNIDSGVAIALGARVDVDLNVTNLTFTDFIVHSTTIPDFELLDWPWNWKIFSAFLHRVSVVMSVENIGNVKVAPSKVSLELYDISKTKLLESSINKSIDQVDSFSTKQVTAYFPTKLSDGQYWGKVKIYKDENIVNVYEIAFTIAKHGELGKPVPSLGMLPWLLMGGYLLVLIIAIAILIKIKIWRLIARLIIFLGKLIAKPVVPIIGIVSRKLSDMKAGFWRWIGSKASNYSSDPTPKPKPKNRRK
jgi:hypothetical protein